MHRFQCPLLRTLWKNQIFTTTVILTSFHGLLEHVKVWRCRVKQKWDFSYLISRQQAKLNWAAFWKSSPNVTINGRNWEDLTWIKTNTKTKIVSPLSSYRSKNISYLNLSSIWNDIVMYYLCPVSTVQNMISIFLQPFLLPILVNERDIEPTVIKKANQFISFKTGDIQLLDIMNFLGGATSLDLILKEYRTSETIRFFPFERVDHPDKMQNTELPPYDAFYGIFRSCNALEAEYADYVNLLMSGLTTEQVVVKLKLSKSPHTGIEHYQYLQQIWKHGQTNSLRDSLRWYSKKDVVLTFEAMQKKIAFYHNEDIDMSKLGCTSPKLANNCLHKSTVV